MTLPSESRIQAAVTELRPDAPVTDITAIETGKNAVYVVSFTDRDAILKVGTATPGRVKAEPAIIRFVRDRTSVPVPEVLQAADDVLAYPCCLYNRVPGRTISDRSTDLSFDRLARLCEEAGQNLADLHSVSPFEACGVLTRSGDGIVVSGNGEAWPSVLRQVMTAKISELGERFAQYRDALRDYADSVDERCQRFAPFDPVLTHMDYRPANLVVDPAASRVTRAVLDWGGAAAAPASYEIAHAKALLTDWPGLTDSDRDALRKRFWAGYAPEGDQLDVPDVYKVDARLRLMKHLDTEVSGRDSALIESRVESHLQSLQRLDVL